MTDTGQATLWAAWRPLAERALNGAALESLSAQVDGLTLAPLHAPAPPAFLGRPSHGPWRRVARIDADGIDAAAELSGGCDALALVFPAAPSAGGRGLSAATVDALDAALADVRLDGIAVHLEAGRDGVGALALLAALAERRGTPPATLHVGLDPLGALFTDGSGPDWPAVLGAHADAVRGVLALGIAGTALVADGRVVAEAGGGAVTELAYALHSIASGLRALDRAGLSPAVALPLFALALSATQDQFATMAKMRAARRLHRLLADACGVATPLTLHATTARRMLALSDPETNLLRLTLAAFAAGVGGADAVAVLPFDGEATPFTRRIARNIGNLLVEEAHLGRLDDPAAGAGAIETYTDALASAAWRLFQEMEADAAFLLDGRFAARVAAERDAAAAATKAGAAPIVGVTVHPPGTPRPVGAAAGVVPPPVAAATGTFAELLAAARAGAPVVGRPPAGAVETTPLRPQRAAEPFGG